MPPSNYYAHLKWQDEIPLATLYNDFYCAKASGVEETKYVLLEHNQLPQRFAKLADQQQFVIGETGFGCGLNFLSCYQLWYRSNRATTNSLHFISVEKHPLHPHDLAKILAKFPHLQQFTQQLIANYYLLLPGYHRFHFKHNVILTLIIGEASESLAQLETRVDAWFLDGFSPNKNPAMWNLATLSQVARLSKAGTTFATFTATAQARRSLQNLGFSVSKPKDFGGKREMLSGSFTATTPSHSTTKPYFTKPQPLANSRSQPIAIIGAGISGAACAYSLAQRGYAVVVFEQNPAVATEASGNPQGILYGSWSAFGGSMMELCCNSYRYSHALIQQLLVPGVEYANPGMLQLAHNQQQLSHWQQLLAANLPPDFMHKVTAEEMAQIAGLPLSHTEFGIYFPSGLWLQPRALVRKLLEHPLIQVKTNTKIERLELVGEQWQLWQANQRLALTTSQVIVANAHAATQFAQISALKLRTLRGQITTITADSPLKSIVCGEAYMLPAQQGKYSIGATFQINDNDCQARSTDDQVNLAKFASIFPDLINPLTPQQLQGRANLRTSSNDYLPLVGPIANYEQFKHAYAKLRQDKNAKLITACPNYPGLYLNLAHGAKGMLTAPYCGELIADYISGTQLAASCGLRHSLHPNRIYLRQLIKRQI